MPFYAKVVDENGQPVEGANIELRLNLHNHAQLLGRPFVKEEWIQLTTDKQGRAELEGYAGYDVSVANVSKIGYLWLYALSGPSACSAIVR